MTSLDRREFDIGNLDSRKLLAFFPVSPIFRLIIFLLPEAAQRFSRFEGFADFRGMQRRKESGASGVGVVFAETACSQSLPSSSLQRSLGRKVLLNESQEECGVGLMTTLHQGNV